MSLPLPPYRRSTYAPSSKQPFERRTNACRIVKSVGRHGGVVPPPRVHSTTVMITSAPVTVLYQTCISDGIHGLAPINAIGCPDERGTYLPTLIRETRGEQRSRMVASQSATHGFVIFGVRVSCPSVRSSICLPVAFSGVTQCTCCVMRRSDACLQYVIASHRPNKPVDLNP